MKVPGHSRVRPWMLLVGVITLVAGHLVALYYGLSHTVLSAATVASGVIVLIVIRHLGLRGPLHALFRRRRGHRKVHSPRPMQNRATILRNYFRK